MLTGIKDMDIFILTHLNLIDIVKFSEVNTYANKICKTEYLWQQIYQKKYGTVNFKPDQRSWRDHYIGVTKLMKFPIIFRW